MTIQQHHLIIQKLSSVGIPEDYLNLGQSGLVAFAANNTSIHLSTLVSVILPTNDDENEEMYRESFTWLQWLMFQGDPKVALSKLGADERGVCGSFLEEENADAYYQCRTCGLHPSSSLCVRCFENGNHVKHDYILIRERGLGYCDCGDITSIKRDGFCSEHIGMELIQPIPEHVAVSLGPVLDFMFIHWRDKLLHANDVQMAANQLTSAVVEMLLEFGKYSESLLIFISERACYSPDLLESLLRAERYLNDDVIIKVRELLLKLVRKPMFKSEFAYAFVDYYPTVVNSVVNDGNDTAFEKYQLVSTFSIYIFITPPLTTHLVEKMDLIGILLQSLEIIFNSCAAEDGKLQAAKLTHFYKMTLRVVEDIISVMRHSTVKNYLCNNKGKLVRKVMSLLASMQGMNPQKQETGSQLDDGNRNIQHLLFKLSDTMSTMIFFLIHGTFSVSDNVDIKPECDDQDSIRRVKVGTLSQKSYSTGIVIHESKAAENLSVASFALWLIRECLRTMGYWLKMNYTVGLSSLEASDATGNYLISLETKGSMVKEVDNTSEFKLKEGLQLQSVSKWSDICYDVSSQAVSVHIPLHRLLSMVLLRSLNKLCEEPKYFDYKTPVPFCSTKNGCDYFDNILGGSHSRTFYAYVMEHPLRIRVFCAQVHAKMWMKNGDAPILFSEWYHSAGRYVQNLELDLFLLQCCAALAPPDLYVHRILERFGLSKYLSMNLEQQDEHEPILVAEMLTLLIQILKERAFCGFDAIERLERDIICKLATGNTTRHNLVKSLSWDLSKLSQLQDVLDQVAICYHPSGATEGIYVLRSHYWKTVDFYHPCWNEKDQQAAEERNLQDRGSPPLTFQLPRWEHIYFPFKGVAKIATCKTLLQIVRSVLFYVVFSENPAPQSVIVRALHLLALALDVCRVHKKYRDHSCYVGDVIPLLAFAHEEIHTGKWGDHSLLSLLVLLTKKMHENDKGSEGGKLSVLSSLLMNVLKKLVEVEPGFSTKLQELAPLVDWFSSVILNGKGKQLSWVKSWNVK